MAAMPTQAVAIPAQQDLGRKLYQRAIALTCHFDLETKPRAVLGARPMGRLIQREIKDKLVDELLFGKLKTGGSVYIKIVEGSIALDITTAPAAK